MALDFPTSPSNGDTHQASNGIQYIFDSTKSQWKSQGEFSSGAIEVKKIDDISGSFNGSTVTFTLNSGGSVVKPHNSQSVLITLNGLVQDPGTAYTTSITTGQITFTSAPTSGKTFTGVIYSRLPVSSSTTLSTTGGTMTGDIVFNSSQTFAIGGIQDGNTSQKGVVQLSTSTTSTSETLAATASAVKSVKDAIPSNLGDLSNVSSSSPSTNHVLKWSGSEWAPSAESGGGASTLAALTDVSSATPSNGQVLKYNTASSQWEPGTDNTGGGGSGGTTNLAAIASGAALTITSSAGTDASIPAATTSSWGAMTDEMFDKLDGIAASANVGITDVVGDTTPQLGGNLDINGKDIVSVSNGDIEIDPNGSGVVIFKGNATKGSGQFKLNCENNSHGITIKGPPHSAAANYTLTLPNNDGDSNQYLQTNGSGVLSWATVDLSTYATLASPALTGTATAVNLTLSGNLIVNGTTTTISSTTIEVTDKNIELGKVASPSDITADGGGLTLKGATDKTFNWVNANNAWTSSEHIHLGDDKKLLVGTGSDLSIYHDASNSYITNTTGNIVIQGKTGEDSIKAIPDGAVELYYDNFKSCETRSNGITLYGPEGTGCTLHMYSDDGDDDADKWMLQNNNDSSWYLKNKVSGSWETNIRAVGDGQVELHHNGEKRLETFINGIVVRGGEGSDGEIQLYADEGDDNADYWRIKSDTSGNFKVGNYSTGSWVDGLTLDGSNNATFAGTVSDSLGDLRSIPENARGTTYTLVATDAGKCVTQTHSSGFTIDNSVFSSGDAVTMINGTGSDFTITQGSGVTLYNTADASTGNRTLASRGMATVWFQSASVGYISGAGLT